MEHCFKDITNYKNSGNDFEFDDSEGNHIYCKALLLAKVEKIDGE